MAPRAPYEAVVIHIDNTELLELIVQVQYNAFARHDFALNYNIIWALCRPCVMRASRTVLVGI
jgi:hypothetical protein